MTTASTQRSRFRATSATGSRRPSATSGCSATIVRPARARRSRTSTSSGATPSRTASPHDGPRGAERSAPGFRATGRLSSGSPARGSARDRRRRSREPTESAGDGRPRCRGSRSILRVDPHVLGAEIAGPDRRRCGAGAEIDRHGDVRALKVLGGLGRCFVVRPAVPEQRRRPDRHRRARQLERDAARPATAIRRPQLGSPP